MEAQQPGEALDAPSVGGDDLDTLATIEAELDEAETELAAAERADGPAGESA